MVAIVNILRGELLLSPWWCVNEGARLAAFESAKSATNDCSLPLIKIASKITKITTHWKNRDSSSALNQSTLECVILTTLVKCARFHDKMTHISVPQARMFDGAQSLQNENFKFFTKINTSNLLKCLCTPAFSIPLLSLEMTTTTDTVQLAEHGLPLAGTTPLS